MPRQPRGQRARSRAARAAAPDYRAACKRLIVSPDFYDAIQHPNAELVTEAIERIEPERRAHARRRVCTSSTCSCSRPASRPTRSCARCTSSGATGCTLADAWAERPNAYLSISIPDFPNFFMLNGPNGPVGNFSLIEVAELQFAYIMQLRRALRDGRVPRDQRDASGDGRARGGARRGRTNTVWVTGCRSWYLDDRGMPAAWPWSFARFREVMAAPDLAAYDLR